MESLRRHRKTEGRQPDSSAATGGIVSCHNDTSDNKAAKSTIPCHQWLWTSRITYMYSTIQNNVAFLAASVTRCSRRRPCLQAPLDGTLLTPH